MEGGSSRFSRQALIAVSITAAVVIVALALWVTAEVFLLAFASVLIAIFLRAVAQPLVRLTHMPMRLVLALLLLAIIAIVALIGILMGPPLVAQFAQLQEKLPEAIDSLGKSGWGGAILQELPIIGHGRGANALSGSVLSQVGAALSTVADIVAHGVFLLFTALFFAFNPDIYVRGAMRLFPPASRNRVRNLAEALNEALRNWLIGQFVSMCIVGVMVGVGLWILGMPLALLLGFLAFAFEFIPIVGPILAAVPGVLVATTESITMALVVAGLYAVVQIIENNVLIPIIQQRMVYVPPAIVLIATFVAALLFGFVGVLVATPLLAAIFVVIKVLYVEDVLHEPIHLPHGFKS